MKKIFLSLLAVAGFLLTHAQNQFEIVPDEKGAKVLKGLITKDILVNDPAFPWFTENQKNFIPDAAGVEALRKNKDSVSFIIFGGTWCEDTQNVLPRFYKMASLAEYPLDSVTLIGVDRNKKTLNHLSEAFGITNVPTFIVMKNGKEIGRVVEYGKTGMPDKEIGEIVQGL